MNLEKHCDLLSTDVSDVIGQACAMDFVYTVRCENRSNTYLHDALYSAPKGAIVVVEAESNDYAIAGGNVCAVAQQNGIAGFVIDGVVRDIAEIRNIGFPVFARGTYPKPGKKGSGGEVKVEVSCGSLAVNPSDLIVADEEGIVVPASDVESVLETALEKKQSRKNNISRMASKSLSKNSRNCC